MSSKDIFRTLMIILAVLVSTYVVFVSINVLVVLLVAIIIASAVRPLVVQLTRWHIFEGLAIVMVYLTIVLGILILVALVIPPIVNQFAANLRNENGLATRVIMAQNWFSNAGQSITGNPIQLAEPEAIRTWVSDVIQAVQDAVPNVVSGASATLGNAILTFVMGAYWLTSHTKAIEFITQLFTFNNREKVHAIIYEIENLMGSYVRGVVFVALFVGMANFLVLLMLHVPNAGTLGFIIGVTTLLPIVGGFLGGSAAVLLSIITTTPLNGLLVLATFVGVQQIETHYLTPRTMARSTGLDPLLTILAILIGFTLYGVVGAVVATPLMGTIAVLLRELVIEPRKINVSAYAIEDGLVVLNSEPNVEPVPATSK